MEERIITGVTFGDLQKWISDAHKDGWMVVPGSFQVLQERYHSSIHEREDYSTWYLVVARRYDSE